MLEVNLLLGAGLPAGLTATVTASQCFADWQCEGCGHRHLLVVLSASQLQERLGPWLAKIRDPKPNHQLDPCFPAHSEAPTNPE